MEPLERDTPLASLAEYPAEARRGDGRLVLASGEAGVGKSALLEQLQNGLSAASERMVKGDDDAPKEPRRPF